MKNVAWQKRKKVNTQHCLFGGGGGGGRGSYLTNLDHKETLTIINDI